MKIRNNSGNVNKYYPAEQHAISGIALTPNQQRYWLAQILHPSLRAHRCPIGVQLRGPLTLASIRKAIDALKLRHPALRTLIRGAEDSPLQYITSGDYSRQLEEIDLSGHAKDGALRCLRRIIQDDLHTPFDLSQACWRVKLFRLSRDYHHVYLNIHHIISDAASIGIFLRELSKLWALAGEGYPSTGNGVCLGVPRIWAESDVIRARAYWADHVKTPPEVRIPADRPRQGISSYSAGVIRRSIEVETVRKLKLGASERDCTLYVALLTAWFVAIYRVTGAEDLITGTMMSGRTHRSQADVIGCFANTLPVRMSIGAADTFSSVLRRVRSCVLLAFEHQHFPLQEIVKQASLPRSLGSPTLFSTLFILQNTIGNISNLFTGLEAEIEEYEELRASSEYDMFLQVRETNGRLSLCLQYSCDLFDHLTGDRFCEVYMQVVETMASNWELSVERFPLVSGQDRVMIEHWNRTEWDFDRSSVVDLFELQATKSPSVIALATRDAEVTYSELNKRAEDVARWLKDHGITNDDIVAICLPRSSSLIASLLGVLKAGSAYLPLDPTYPLERLERILYDARPTYLIGTPETQECFSSFEGTVLLLGQEGCLCPSTCAAPRDSIRPNQRAYVLYTSGSTGKPKGVEVEHGSVANLVKWGLSFFTSDELKAVSAGSSLCFDSSVFEILVPLCAGGKVILLESIIHMREHPWWNEITLLTSGAPTAVYQLAREGIIPKHTITIALAGEPLPPDLISSLYQHPNIGRVLNLYGLTETAVYSTVGWASPTALNSPPIGLPIANTQIYILDKFRNPVPIGVTGEAYIGGAGLGRGFIGQPEETAISFTKVELFGRCLRLYKTGDLVRQRNDGNIEFLTRYDRQVKFRGLRIELGEIELALRRHPAVREAVVVASHGSPGDSQLLAYLVGKEQHVVPDELRRHLAERLPVWMIPSQFIEINELPSTPNGKVDRTALPPLAVPHVDADLQDSPTNATEEAVAAIWAGVLGREHLGVRQNFFDVGGHSLLIPVLRLALERHFNVLVTITDLFTYTTIARLAEFIESAVMKGRRVAVASADRTRFDLQPKEYEEAGFFEIAIVSMACRFPGADTPEDFWRSILSNDCAVREVPSERWQWQVASRQAGLPTGDESLRWGAFIRGIELFDHNFFQISLAEARCMDPRQRLLLEIVWELIERAGHRCSDFVNCKVGVFVGASSEADCNGNFFEAPALNTHSASGKADAMLANRISYSFGFTGPSLVVDTACSSSLVALHIAAQSLRNGESDVAIVIGASMLLSCRQPAMWSQSGMLSPTGSSIPFDHDANGFVPGEGIGAILLRPLRCAQKEQDQIVAVLESSAINHDGRCKIGLTAPSPDGQMEVVRRAWETAGIDASSVSYIETHGTGTPLGDPVELAGLSRAFQRDTQKKAFCAIGSSKGQIGHLGPASGIASVIKVALCLQNRTIPPHYDVMRPNNEIAFEDSPFYLNDRARDWLSGNPMRVGVSAFGFGGTNAHACFRQWPGPALLNLSEPDQRAQVLTITAPTLTSLKKLTECFLVYLRNDEQALADICFTANTGRQVFEHRIAVIANSREEMMARLAAILSTDVIKDSDVGENRCIFSTSCRPRRIPGDSLLVRTNGLLWRLLDTECFHNDLSESFRSPQAPTGCQSESEAAAQALPIACDEFVRGAAIRWASLYEGISVRRVCLPTLALDRVDCSQACVLVPSYEADLGCPPTPLRTPVLRKVASNPHVPSATSSICIVFSREKGMGATVIEDLRRRGARVIKILPGSNFSRIDSDTYVIAPEVSEDYRTVFTAIEEGGVHPTKLVHLWVAHAPQEKFDSCTELEARLDLGLRSLFHIGKHIPAGWVSGLTLFITTMNAEPFGAIPSLAPDQGALWGLRGSLEGENVGMICRCIDVDKSECSQDLAGREIVNEILSGAADREVVLRSGSRYIRAEVELIENPLASLAALRRGSCYLITGGCGGVGLQLAIWLVETVGAKIIVTGRTTPEKPSQWTQWLANRAANPEEKQIISQLRQRSAEVLFARADVCDAEAMQRVLARGREMFGPLHGIFHLAAVNGKAPIRNTSMEEFNCILEAKTRGALVLDRISQKETPAFIAVFSSISGLYGNVLQAAYSAANRFLDGFATWRSAEGRPTVAINWPGWSKIGLANRVDCTIPAMPSAALLGMLERVLNAGESRVILLPPSTSVPPAQESSKGTSDQKARGSMLSADVDDAVISEIANTLCISPATVNRDQSLFDLGLDSIFAGQMALQLGARLCCSFPRAFFLDNGSINAAVAAAKALLSACGRMACEPRHTDGPQEHGGGSSRVSTLAGTAGYQMSKAVPIAVIGMAGRIPTCRNLEEFWEMLRDGREAEIQAGGRRFNADIPFRHELFGISHQQAVGMDIQQKLVLDVALEAVESASGGRDRLSCEPTGVFVGANSGTLQNGLGETPTPYTLLGISLGVLANRISHFLDLRGPSLSVDCLCASSLAAMHLAVQSLRSGECSYALVAGVRAGISEAYETGADLMGVLSPSGECRAFDQQADGTVLGEGIFVLLLRRLDGAIEDGDTVHGIIRGISLSHNGRNGSMVIPSASNQAETIMRALEAAGLSPDDISYVEAHGTGTFLGDPIEIQGLTRAFQSPTRIEQTCAIGTLKPNIGHLEAAAGLAGVVKVLLAMQRGLLPPAIKVQEPNSQISFERTPFYVCDRLSEWPTANGRRFASVNAFGMGGVNAHVILEGPPQEVSSLVMLPKQARSQLAIGISRPSAVTDGKDRDPRNLTDGTIPTEKPNLHSNTAGRLQRLQELVARALGLEESSSLTMNESFLERGADSLILGAVLRELRKHFSLELSIRDLLSGIDTVVKLDVEIERRQGAARDSEEDRAQLRECASQEEWEPGATENAGATGDSIASSKYVSGGSVVEASRRFVNVECPAGNGVDVEMPFVPYRPFVPSIDATIDAKQKAFLEGLTRRYSSRSRRSKEFAQQFRGVHSDSRASAGFRFSVKEMLYPIVGSRAEGSRVWDLDGNEYVDITMGFGVHLFGHAPEFIFKALRATLNAGMPLGVLSEVVGPASAAVCRAVGMERNVFCASGTEAVMLALRLARSVTRRNKIVIFQGSYHGCYDGTLAVPSEESANGRPMAPGLLRWMDGDVLVLPYGVEESLKRISKEAGSLAAVIVEPVQSRRPEFQPREFLHELRELTTRSGIALIFDEIVTGFRCHAGGAQAWFGVRADLATYGKVLGGGLPIGAVAGEARFIDALDGGDWRYGDRSFPEVQTTFAAGTFWKHPLSIVAALQVLEEIGKRGPTLQQELNIRTDQLVSRLNQFLKEQRAGLELVHFSSLFRFASSENIDLLFYLLMERGVLVWEGRNFFLSTAHSAADLDYVERAIQDSVVELQDAGFLPLVDRTSRVVRESGSEAQLLPLTEEQRGIWLFTMFGGSTSSAYHESVLVTLTGALDLRRFAESFGALLQRHDALRVQITPDGHQRFSSRASTNLCFTDWSTRTSKVTSAEISAWSRQESTKPFSLEEGSLFRAHVLTLPGDIHVVLLTAHHLIADGPSVSILVEDLARCYSLGELEWKRGSDASSWAMFVRARHDQALQFSSTAWDYWSQRLQQAPEMIDLPVDWPRPAILTSEGSRVRVSLSPELTNKLRFVGATSGATLQMVILAAFKTLLMRWVGQNDLIVGVPHTLRKEGLERLVGHCMQMLPIRTRPSAAVPFDTYLKTVREAVLEAVDNSDVSFEKLVASIRAKRDPSHPPLFNVEFNMDPSSRVPDFYTLGSRLGSLSSPEVPFDCGLGGDTAELDAGTAKFDLTLNLMNCGEGVGGVIEYNTQLFKRGTIERLAQNLVRIIESIAENASCSLGSLEVLTSEDKLSLAQWNNTTRQFPLEDLLPSVLRAGLPAHGASVALSCQDVTITYGQWYDGALRVAELLKTALTPADKIVAVLCPRDAHYAVLVMGVWIVGCAFLPLDPEHPSQRIADVLSRSRPPVLLYLGAVREKLTDVLKHIDGPRPVSLSWSNSGTETALSACCCSAAPYDLAYVIFTSGTSGRPKGALLEHRGMNNHLWSKVSALSLSHVDNIAQTASQCFDISIWQLFAAVLVGAKVTVFENDIVRDAVRLLEEVVKNEITILEIVPSLLREMLRHLEETGPLTLPLRWLLVTGESLQSDLCRRWLNIFPDIPLLNAYGPTECSDDVTHYVIRATHQVGETVAPIGKPIPNIRIYVLDEYCQQVPVGWRGELYVGGVGVGRGYLDDPEGTSAALFSRSGVDSSEFLYDCDRLYRTGDRARFLVSGDLEFLGRGDQFIKYHGFGIDAREIEAVIESQSGVREAIVLTQGNDEELRLIAYIVLDLSRNYELEEDIVAQWKSVFDAVIGSGDTTDQEAGLRAWVSSYSRGFSPRHEVADYLDESAARIKSLHPRRLIEIGCGSGMVLQRVASACSQYIGTDISSESLRRLKNICVPADALSLSFLQQPAIDWGNICPGRMDTLVLHEVVQYFPTVEYLEETLARAMEYMAVGGRIYIGGVRSLPLLPMFRASVLDCSRGYGTPGALSLELDQRLREERELVLAPCLFIALAKRFDRIKHVEVLPRIGHFCNEFTCFRYDVILHLDILDPPTPVIWMKNEGLLTAAVLRQFKCDTSGKPFGLRKLYDARLKTSSEALRKIRSDKEQFGDRYAYDVRLLAEMAAEADLECRFSWANTDAWGSFDIVCGEHVSELSLRLDFSCASSSPESAAASNVPALVTAQTSLVPKLRALMEARLPLYMIPSRFAVVSKLPLNENGKVDRRRLPLINFQSRDPGCECLPARDTIEYDIVRIWESLLVLRPIGVRDHFFACGGDSLLATRLVTRLRERFGEELPLSLVFQCPTIEKMARAIRSTGRYSAELFVEIKPGIGEPLYCVHAVGGGVACYYELSRCLEPDQEVFGIQTHGLGAVRPSDGITEIASEYVRRLRERQAFGPYHLLGWSVGGLIAYEMACQLRESGQDIGRLFLLDSEPASAMGPGEEDEVAWRSFVEQFGIPWERMGDTLTNMHSTERLSALHREIKHAGTIVDGAEERDLAALHEVFLSNWNAYRKFRPNAFSGELDLFVCGGAHEAMLRSWDFSSDVQVRIHDAGGTHQTMLCAPHVGDIGVAIQSRLKGG